MYRKVEAIVGLIVFITEFSNITGAEEKVDFKLVKEWKFDKEIKDAAFGETEDGSLYPKIIVFEDEIRFYDEKGEIIKKLDLHPKYSKVIFSRKINYIGISTIKRFATILKSGLRNFVVYTDKGDKFWEMNEKIMYDVPLLYIYLSDKDGFAVGVLSCAGIVVFFDSTGKELKRIDLFKNDEFDYEKGSIGAFSGNGKSFVLNIQESPGIAIGALSQEDSGRSGNPHLFLFNYKGKEIWKVNLPGFYSNNVFISPSGEYIIGVVSCFHIKKGMVSPYTLLLNKKGEIIKKYTFYTRCAAFSPNEEYAVVGYWEPVSTIQLIKNKNGKVILNYKFDASVDKINNLIVSNEGIIAIIFDNNEVCILNSAGEIIYRKIFPEEVSIKLNISSLRWQIVTLANKKIKLMMC